MKKTRNLRRFSAVNIHPQKNKNSVMEISYGIYSILNILDNVKNIIVLWINYYNKLINTKYDGSFDLLFTIKIKIIFVL